MQFFGEIITPPRSSRFATVVIALTVLFFILVHFSAQLTAGAPLSQVKMIGGATTGWIVLAISAVLVALAWISRDANARAFALLAATFVFAIATSPWIESYTAHDVFTVLYVVAPIPYVFTILFVPGLSGAFAWMRVGSIGVPMVIAIVLLVLLSVAGTAIEFLLLNPDYSHQPLLSEKLFSGPSLIFAGVCIALLNAAVEESAFRGVMMNALDSAFGPGTASVIAQATAFGAFHYNSTERGIGGVFLAAIFGLVLGVLRRKTKGILAPYLLHVPVDIAIWLIGITQSH